MPVRVFFRAGLVGFAEPWALEAGLVLSLLAGAKLDLTNEKATQAAAESVLKAHPLVAERLAVAIRALGFDPQPPMGPREVA